MGISILSGEFLCGDLRKEITTAARSLNTNFDARSYLLR
jgi:hypothetical protein